MSVKIMSSEEWQNLFRYKVAGPKKAGDIITLCPQCADYLYQVALSRTCNWHWFTCSRNWPGWVFFIAGPRGCFAAQPYAWGSA